MATTSAASLLGHSYATADDRISVGNTLDDYTMMEALGEGSFGKVRKVQSKIDKEFYVIKKVSFKGLSVARQQKCVGEVLLLRRFRHPNVIRYYTSFVENHNLYMVMEYAENDDLQYFVLQHRKCGMRVEEGLVWKLLFEIASGLAVLHKQRIVHRDIKCGNIMLGRQNQAKIGDLGLSTLMTEDAIGPTETDVGTRMYQSPELLKKQSYNEAVDIWSLGCVLFMLCGNYLPFPGKDPVAVAEKILTTEPQPLPPTVSGPLRQLLSAMLNKDPEQRPKVGAVIEIAYGHLSKAAVAASPTAQWLSREKLARPSRNAAANTSSPKGEERERDRIVRVAASMVRRPSTSAATFGRRGSLSGVSSRGSMMGALGQTQPLRLLHALSDTSKQVSSVGTDRNDLRSYDSNDSELSNTASDATSDSANMQKPNRTTNNERAMLQTLTLEHTQQQCHSSSRGANASDGLRSEAGGRLLAEDRREAGEISKRLTVIPSVFGVSGLRAATAVKESARAHARAHAEEPDGHPGLQMTPNGPQGLLTSVTHGRQRRGSVPLAASSESVLGSALGVTTATRKEFIGRNVQTRGLQAEHTDPTVRSYDTNDGNDNVKGVRGRRHCDKEGNSNLNDALAPERHSVNQPLQTRDKDQRSPRPRSVDVLNPTLRLSAGSTATHVVGPRSQSQKTDVPAPNSESSDMHMGHNLKSGRARPHASSGHRRDDRGQYQLEEQTLVAAHGHVQSPQFHIKHSQGQSASLTVATSIVSRATLGTGPACGSRMRTGTQGLSRPSLSTSIGTGPFQSTALAYRRDGHTIRARDTLTSPVVTVRLLREAAGRKPDGIMSQSVGETNTSTSFTGPRG